MTSRNSANVFYEGLKNNELGNTFDYLSQMGGSGKWITALADKVQSVSTKKLDEMKSDLAFHFRLLAKKHEDGIKKGMLWNRKMPPNLTKELLDCNGCGDFTEITIEHVLDMHPDICLFCGSGTDEGFNPETVSFVRKQK